MRLSPMSLAITAGIAGCSDVGASAGQAGAASAGGVAIRDAEGAPDGCSLTIRFGSYAMGIDRGAARRIEQLLTSAPDIRSVTRHGWGREGEYTLCVTTASATDAAALLAAIRPLLPAAPRGPIEVALADGTKVSAPKR
ncbi:MAG TPA: hypothetical protein VGW34_10810 [Allosphingosinicella sp.]|nr:hypothetical protein [Allosphingosinicella sp.]